MRNQMRTNTNFPDDLILCSFIGWIRFVQVSITISLYGTAAPAASFSCAAKKHPASTEGVMWSLKIWSSPQPRAQSSLTIDEYALDLLMGKPYSVGFTSIEWIRYPGKSCSSRKTCHLNSLVHSCRNRTGRHRRTKQHKITNASNDFPRNPFWLPMELLAGESMFTYTERFSDLHN